MRIEALVSVGRQNETILTKKTLLAIYLGFRLEGFLRWGTHLKQRKNTFSIVVCPASTQTRAALYSDGCLEMVGSSFQLQQTWKLERLSCQGLLFSGHCVHRGMLTC